MQLRARSGITCELKMTDTRQLLTDYVRHGSDSAFRYLDFVYSTALRLADGDAYRAGDGAQVVFVNLPPGPKIYHLTIV